MALVLDASKAALGHRRPAEGGLLMHTDQGSQYTSSAHFKALQAAGLTAKHELSAQGHTPPPPPVPLDGHPRLAAMTVRPQDLGDYDRLGDDEHRDESEEEVCDAEG